MDAPTDQRQLTAILLTDMAGYTETMARDEQLARRLVRRQREVLLPHVEAHGGEMLREFGDGFLITFESVIEAVRCALKVQAELQAEHEPALRIGIHIGDVVLEEGSLQGSGVNIASRIETMTPPRGVCVSDVVWDQIHNQPDLTTISLGSHGLKGVSRQVEVYQVFVAGSEAARVAAEAMPADAGSRIPAETPALAEAMAASGSGKHATRYGVTGLIVVSILLAAGYFFSFRGTRVSVPRVSNARQVTSATGVEQAPIWSPDGRMLAYQSGQNGNMDIWVTQVEGGQPVNRTADYEGFDGLPTWSTDGSQITFTSQRDGIGTFVMPAIGGLPRKVNSDYSSPVFMSPSLLSSDGTKLAYMTQDSTGFGFGVRIVTIAGGDAQYFSLPGRSPRRFELRWSPDGRFFVYVDQGSITSEVTQLWVLRLADGKGIPVTDGWMNDRSPTWSTDGRMLYFVSNRGGSMDLWQQRLGIDGFPEGDPQSVTTGVGMYGSSSAVMSPDGTKLAYVKGREFLTNLWRVPILPDRPVTLADAQQLTFDEAFIEFMDVSPDGRQILFSSDRAGNHDLWLMPVEGGEPQQLTIESTPDWNPRWSPNGKKIAFYAYRSGNRDIWVMPSEGGPARQVTFNDTPDTYPAWSPNGKEIAFDSRRSGNNAIWVIPAAGGEARQVTERGSYPRWSPDGKWLSFLSRFGETRLGLWRVPVTGGEPDPLIEKPTVLSPNWSPDGATIYFFTNRDQRENIWALSVDDRTERQVTDFKDRPGSIWGGSLATDGKFLYFSWREPPRGDLWTMDVEWE